MNVFSPFQTTLVTSWVPGFWVSSMRFGWWLASNATPHHLYGRLSRRWQLIGGIGWAWWTNGTGLVTKEILFLVHFLFFWFRGTGISDGPRRCSRHNDVTYLYRQPCSVTDLHCEKRKKSDIVTKLVMDQGLHRSDKENGVLHVRTTVPSILQESW